MEDLFAEMRVRTELGTGAVWLPGFVDSVADQLLQHIHSLSQISPFRFMMTPGGRSMSVAMTSCGACGWYTDKRGYRYVRHDPMTGQYWPDMPDIFRHIAVAAAQEAGFSNFTPVSCLLNRYEPGAKMGLHQDRDEDDLASPIVSVSLGVPARFAFGGLQKTDPVRRFDVRHGDVMVWGGPSRLAWHGVSPVRETFHQQTGAMRYNLTFRAINPALFQP
ncbi:MAG: DNA oxidative demethylase AlkB [Gluconobacter cerinus]|uniref:DNA oxidative demethylase AlkB n=1 Tax=Gluconobacter cerinus TaxID=38307 RepID=UPI0039EA4ABA